MSLFGMAYMQVNETILNTGIGIRAVNPDFSYLQASVPSTNKRGTTMCLRNPEVHYRQKKLGM